MPDLSYLDEECAPYVCGPQGHTGVAGLMWVDDEDLHTVAQQRQINGDKPIECNQCDARYLAGSGWVLVIS